MPQKRTYSQNLKDIAYKIKHEKCHVTVIGDSINNPTQEGYFRAGMVNSFQPDYWRGISTVMSAGSGESGFKAQLYNGTSLSYKPIIEGVHKIALAHKDTPLLSEYIRNKIIEPTFLGEVTCEGISDGTNAYRITQISAGTIESGAVTLLGTQQATQANAFYSNDGYTLKFLIYSPDTFTLTGKFRTLDSGVQTVVDFSIVPGYNYVEHTMSPATTNVTPGLGVTAELLFATGTADGTKVTILSSYAYNPNIDGLSLSYVGTGGYRPTNHASFDGSGVDGWEVERGEPGWYETEALIEHFKFFETDMCLIYLGANGGEDDFINSMEGVFNRISYAASQANRNIEILVVTCYDLFGVSGSDILNFMEERAGYPEYPKVGFIDLWSYSVDQYGYNSTLRAIGYLDTDFVHPLLAGSNAFASLIWNAISDADDYVYYSPWDFQVAQARRGSWEDLSEDVSYDTNDVVQELSGLATKVVDEDSEYTAFISGMSAFKKGKK